MIAPPRARRLVVAALVVGSVLGGALLSGCGDDGGGSDGSDGSDGPALSAAGRRGQTVAKEQGCTSCHTTDGSRSSGPSWKDLAGSPVVLDDGTETVADDDYLRQAIVASRSQVVKGYPNIMPVYQDELTDAEVDDLIAYLHDLSAASEATDQGATTGS